MKKKDDIIPQTTNLDRLICGRSSASIYRHCDVLYVRLIPQGLRALHLIVLHHPVTSRLFKLAAIRQFLIGVTGVENALTTWKRTAEHPREVVGREESIFERLGWKKEPSGQRSSSISTRKKGIALILCLCFGVFGAHRFYTGKNKSAKVQLFTFGGLGVWFLTDLVLIIVGEFSDGEGRKIREWV